MLDCRQAKDTPKFAWIRCVQLLERVPRAADDQAFRLGHQHVSRKARDESDCPWHIGSRYFGRGNFDTVCVTDEGDCGR